MFGPLGVPELIVIFVLALLLFGPRRLPELGRTVGKAIGEFRRATTDLQRSINTEIALEEEKERPKRPPRREVEARVSEEGLLEPAPAGTVAREGAPAEPAGEPAGGEPAEVSAAESVAEGDAEAAEGGEGGETAGESADDERAAASGG